MQHANTAELLTYWNSRRAGRAFPSRNEIEPADIAKLLPHVLIGEVVSQSERKFRLAGTGLCALAGRELKGTDISDLWLPEMRRNISSVLNAVTDGYPAILTLDGVSESGRVLHAEGLFLPTGGPEGNCNRLLGIISVINAPYWVGHDPLLGFSTTGFRLIDPAQSNPFIATKLEIPTPPANPGGLRETKFGPRSNAPFLVIDGGRR